VDADEETEASLEGDVKPRRSSRSSGKDASTVDGAGNDHLGDEAKILSALFAAVRMADGSVSDDWLVCRSKTELLALERRIQDIVEFIESVEAPADGSIPVDLCDQPVFTPVLSPAAEALAASTGAGACSEDRSGNNEKGMVVAKGSIEQYDRADVELVKFLEPPPRRYSFEKNSRNNIIHSRIRATKLNSVMFFIY
jgi:hypothetical protein